MVAQFYHRRFNFFTCLQIHISTYLLLCVRLSAYVMFEEDETYFNYLLVLR